MRRLVEKKSTVDRLFDLGEVMYVKVSSLVDRLFNRLGKFFGLSEPETLEDQLRCSTSTVNLLSDILTYQQRHPEDFLQLASSISHTTARWPLSDGACTYRSLYQLVLADFEVLAGVSQWAERNTEPVHPGPDPYAAAPCILYHRPPFVVTTHRILEIAVIDQQTRKTFELTKYDAETREQLFQAYVEQVRPLHEAVLSDQDQVKLQVKLDQEILLSQRAQLQQIKEEHQRRQVVLDQQTRDRLAREILSKRQPPPEQ